MRIFSNPSLIFFGSSGKEEDSDKDDDGEEDGAALTAICADTGIAPSWGLHALHAHTDTHDLPPLPPASSSDDEQQRAAENRLDSLSAHDGLRNQSQRCGTNGLAGRREHSMPGWDYHGLPIGLKDTQSLQQDKESRESTGNVESPSYFGIMADWSKQHTYRTLDPAYEANQLQVFGQMARSGLIYRQYRPVYWSPSSKTDLAGAELEYNDIHRSRSAYVRFKLDHIGPALREVLGGEAADVTVSISWSGPRLRGHCLQMRIGRVPAKSQVRDSIGALEVLATTPGASLLDSTYRHPCLPTAASKDVINATGPFPDTLPKMDAPTAQEMLGHSR
ncbi:hypothetical protein CF326_g7974 [Tilletia indica]|nr:hypothetical protein CF326_g7974 [Tilletia indica]